MNSGASRNRILSRLRHAPKAPRTAGDREKGTTFRGLSPEEKIERLKRLMEAVRTEVHVVKKSGWVEVFVEILRKKGAKSVVYAPRTEAGAALEKLREGGAEEGEPQPELIAYEENVERIKERLFRADAAITTTKGAVADAGAIVLWPDEKEPRLMSLVPPIHFAVVDAETIFDTLSEAMENQSWSEKMPANALLISGPSKTADIELTLAFGVHGPKELVVLIRTGDPDL